MEEEESAEFRTVKKCAPLLQKALKGLESKVVYFLNEKGFITDDVMSQVLNVKTVLSVTDKTLMLVEGIKTRVDLDEDSYHELVHGFSQGGPHYAPIVKKLNEEYQRQTSTKQQNGECAYRMHWSRPQASIPFPFMLPSIQYCETCLIRSAWDWLHLALLNRWLH